MTDLFQNPDGASPQAQAVLAYLRQRDGIENSYEESGYAARPTVHRWCNCREQGYVILLRSADYTRQLNIAFFEHRNSDEICAVKWEQTTINPPTIDTAIFGDVYKDKHDVSHSVGCGQADKMAKWIYEQLAQFWAETRKQEAA